MVNLPKNTFFILVLAAGMASLSAGCRIFNKHRGENKNASQPVADTIRSMTVVDSVKGVKPVVAAPKKDSIPVFKVPPDFTLLPSGLYYKPIVHGQGTRKPQLNDHIELNIHIHIKDSILFDSRKMYNDKPVPLVIQAAKSRGDLMEGFTNMVVGDSAVFLFSADSLKRSANQQVPPWAKRGDYYEYDVVLATVRTDEEEKKYRAEQAAIQNAIDDKILQDYFKKNKKLKPLKTASGLYYTISKQGKGPNAKDGLAVTANYTGRLLEGQVFDSNTDSLFHHVQPYPFVVGKGIKGWDEGLLLLKKGSKATFYIPSTLAYGPMDQRGIPANSILVFDVEALDITDPADQAATDDKLLQEYFAKNKIKPTKTSSGLYYVINRKGMGRFAKPGKKVTVNYVGKTLDGKVFDSNTDPSKGHVAPFQFTLGVGMVIKGWEEGIQLLQMASKATFYIPSALAYGQTGAKNIPSNSVLIFDVEVTGIDK